MFYTIKSPWVLRKTFPGYTWKVETDQPVLYLTFDDGPHPEITGFVLDELKRYNAKATFFCIGNNVALYPETYKRILMEGHRVGNHTYSHLNGWKTNDKKYLDDVLKAREHINSDLFRPPYGKITGFQARLLSRIKTSDHGLFRIVMWDVLSADFDINLTAEKCYTNVVKNVSNGSIIVFHDSEKAFPRLKNCLPEVLKTLVGKGYRLEAIS